jgi:Zn-finger nucleic acid-binding protein
MPCAAWNDAAAHEHRCPRCAGKLERVELDGVHVEQCARCLGCFVRTEDFSELLKRDEAGEVEPKHFAPLAPGRALPRQTLLALVRCPHCPREMDRARFAERASLVVDVCAPHGIWLDAGELAGVLDFVKQRTTGHVESDAAERADREQWDRVERMQATEQSIIDMHVRRAQNATRGPSPAAVMAATAIAGPWAGLFVAVRGMNKRS